MFSTLENYVRYTTSIMSNMGNAETINLDVRTHGTVLTAMGSPLLENQSTPITIVEFGDYQCSLCYNWVHDTRSSICLDF